jgi:hypothetical protein
MKISVDRFSTDDVAEQLTLITLTNAEAKELADQLITAVGEKRTPTKLIEKMTNQMAELFLD